MKGEYWSTSITPRGARISGDTSRTRRRTAPGSEVKGRAETRMSTLPPSRYSRDVLGRARHQLQSRVVGLGLDPGHEGGVDLERDQPGAGAHAAQKLVRVDPAAGPELDHQLGVGDPGHVEHVGHRPPAK